MVSDESLRRQAVFLQAAATFIVVGAVINYLRVGEVAPFVLALASGGPSADEVDGFIRGLAIALPTFFYAAAVWVAGGIFGRIGKGEIFSRKNSAALGSVGGWISTGALVGMLVTPGVIDWLAGGGPRFRVEPTDMLLALIGGLIQMLGIVHARAAALRSELDQII